MSHKCLTFLNYIQYQDKATRFERPNTLPSSTVPDMAMSAREILIRFAQGRPVSVSNKLHYTGDEYLPDVRKMDLVERDEMIEANKSVINTLKKEIDDKVKARKALAIKKLEKPKKDDKEDEITIVEEVK